MYYCVLSYVVIKTTLKYAEIVMYKILIDSCGEFTKEMEENPVFQDKKKSPYSPQNKLFNFKCFFYFFENVSF